MCAKMAHVWPRRGTPQVVRSTPFPLPYPLHAPTIPPRSQIRDLKCAILAQFWHSGRSDSQRSVNSRATNFIRTCRSWP